MSTFGVIGIGTLFHHAKQGGWKTSSTESKSGQTPPKRDNARDWTDQGYGDARAGDGTASSTRR